MGTTSCMLSPPMGYERACTCNCPVASAQFAPQSGLLRNRSLLLEHFEKPPRCGATPSGSGSGQGRGSPRKHRTKETQEYKAVGYTLVTESLQTRYNAMLLVLTCFLQTFIVLDIFLVAFGIRACLQSLLRFRSLKNSFKKKTNLVNYDVVYLPR